MATLHTPITISRSDGVLETMQKGRRELNQPSPEQLDDTPDATGMVDCYRKIGYNDSKSVDWRRKLAGMLKNYHGIEKDRNPNKQYILENFPDGYVLWEHVKYKVDKLAEGKREKGKHAAGPFERQDAYLYGHPEGRRKRYRSPADFFHHINWLVSASTDRDDCCCKICSPDGDDDAPTESVKKIEVVIKKDIKPVAVAAPRNNPPPPPLPQKIPMVPPKLTEQMFDARMNGKYLYRPGELIWFNRGSAWGLAVISKRQLLNDKPRYLVQPLSHPIQHLPAQIKDKEDDIRPWLAWSVPETTIARLSNAIYETVPWDQVVKGQLGPGAPEVDASILAAKMIDRSYSLFDRIENAPTAHNEVQYKGMFLGAEKIWTGEPVRLRLQGNDIAVLVIDKMIEQTLPPTTSIVTFVGDVYKFVEMPMPYKNRAEWPTPALPARMVADLRFRNEVADNAKKGIWCEWRLLEPAARKGLQDVRGRWYESRALLPALRTTQQFQQDIMLGNISDTGIWMNSRAESGPHGGQRKKNRKDTLSNAVPADFKVSRGLDGTPAEDQFPDVRPAQQVQPPQPRYADVDQFMDLDQAYS